MSMPRCIRIPKAEGESVRSRLVDADLLDKRYKIRAEGDFLIMPVLCDFFEGYEATEAKVEERTERPADYREVLDFPD